VSVKRFDWTRLQVLVWGKEGGFACRDEKGHYIVTEICLDASPGSLSPLSRESRMEADRGSINEARGFCLAVSSGVAGMVCTRMSEHPRFKIWHRV
jgi:hypothetical protein